MVKQKVHRFYLPSCYSKERLAWLHSDKREVLLSGTMETKAGGPQTHHPLSLHPPPSPRPG